MSKKKQMSSADARRIQSTQDRKGTSGDTGFVSRSMKATHNASKPQGKKK